MSFITQPAAITDPQNGPVYMTTTSGPTYYSGSTYTWSLTALDSYVTYTVTTTNGTATLSGSTLSYTPATAGAGGFTINGRGISLTVSTLSNWIGILSYPVGSGTYAQDIASDSSSNIIVAGTLNNGAYGGLTKITPQAAVSWTTGVNVSQLNAVAISSSDTIAAVGLSGTYPSYLVYIATFNSSGAIVSQVGGNQTKYFNANGAAVYESTNFIISGQNATSTHLYVAKFDASLAITWQRTLTFTSLSSGGVAKDSAGNIYACAYYNPGGAPTGVLVKYNSSGVIQWQKSLSGSSQVNTAPVAVDSADNIYVGGSLNSTNALIVKYDTSGNLIWARQIAPTSSTFSFYKLSVDSSNNVYAVSNASSGSPDKTLIVKYNSSGVIQYQRIFGASGSTSGISVSHNDISPDGKMVTYSVAISGPLYIGEILRSPNDGTLTGTYTVGSTTMVYSVSTFTESDASGSVTAGTAPGTDAAGTMTVSAASFTATAITQTNTVTGI